MKAAWNAVYWEVLRKNRLVFVALGILLTLGTALAWVSVQAPPGAEWVAAARRLTVMAFLVSILIAYAPFTLMETGGGWRMNSMVTRWFALPMRTGWMVLGPMLVGMLFLGLFVWLWMQPLRKLEPTLNGGYTMAMLTLGLVALNAWAWIVPRKPIQFWAGAGVLFPVMLIVTAAAQDRPHGAEFHAGMLVPLGTIAALLAGFAWFAAARNRCGAWPGEVPLDWLLVLLRGARVMPRTSDFRSSGKAMFATEGWPALRLLAASWLALVAVLFVYVSLVFRESRGGGAYAFSWRVLPLIGLGILPVFGILWMAVWGVFTAGEPSAVFRSRLASFRATLPVTCGQLAAQRIGVLFAGWCVVWVPLVLLSYFPDPDMMASTPAEIQRALSRLASTGAFTLVGALPVLLLGRFEGFPNFLLASICAWAVTYGVNANLKVLPGEDPGNLWYVMGALLMAKGGVAVWAMRKALKAGHVTWRFPVGLAAGWTAALSLLTIVIPVWKEGGAWAVFSTMLFLPIARLALCPLAIAENRHRR